MTNFEEKLKSISNRVAMSEKERNEMKSSILSLIEGKNEASIPSPYMNMWFFVRKHSFSVVFAAVLFFSGSISTLAENSLPGDILYPLKVGVNEEVLGWFAKSDNAKSEWQISLAERRLDEVEKLQEIGSLTEDSRQRIEIKIDEHARNAEERVGIESVDAEDFSVVPEIALMKTSLSEVGEVTTMMASIQVDSTISSGTPATSTSNDSIGDFLVESDVDLNEELKELRVKITELNQLVENMEDTLVFFERSKVRLNVVRARENLLKASSILESGDERDVDELLNRAREYIARAEDIVYKIDNQESVPSKEEVRGARTEVKGKEKKDRD